MVCVLFDLLFQIDKQQFEETIQTLNNLYAEAEKLGGRSYLEGCLACITAYTIFLCMETHYEKVNWEVICCGLRLIDSCFSYICMALCLFHSGAEKDRQVHSGAEWEDIRTSWASLDWPHRTRAQSCILFYIK